MILLFFVFFLVQVNSYGVATRVWVGDEHNCDDYDQFSALEYSKFGGCKCSYTDHPNNLTCQRLNYEDGSGITYFWGGMFTDPDEVYKDCSENNRETSFMTYSTGTSTGQCYWWNASNPLNVQGYNYAFYSSVIPWFSWLGNQIDYLTNNDWGYIHWDGLNCEGTRVYTLVQLGTAGYYWPLNFGVNATCPDTICMNAPNGVPQSLEFFCGETPWSSYDTTLALIITGFVSVAAVGGGCCILVILIIAVVLLGIIGGGGAGGGFLMFSRKRKKVAVGDSGFQKQKDEDEELEDMGGSHKKKKESNSNKVFVEKIDATDYHEKNEDEEKKDDDEDKKKKKKDKKKDKKEHHSSSSSSSSDDDEK